MMAKKPKRKGVNTLTRTIDFTHPMAMGEIAHSTYYGFDGKLDHFENNGGTYRLHHSARYPIYASRFDRYRFYPYEGRYGTGYVRFVQIPNQRGSLCTIEYWIRQGDS